MKAKPSPLKSGNYLKRIDLFFDSSKLLFAQVTDIFDFTWPTVAGMWNLRWQVNGYLAENPSAGVEELKGKFTKGSGGEGGNLKRACKEFSWDEQKEQFATFLLINAFAFYESWIKNILKDLGNSTVAFEKAMQKRTTGPSTAPTGGIQFALNILKAPSSNTMHYLFYDTYLRNEKNGLLILDNLIVCYKCFKELRNCVMHNGSVADQKFINAYSDYSLLAPTDLNVAEVPVVEMPTIDKPVKVSLRGVVGFYDIILKLVATLDAELSVSERASKILILKSRKASGRSISLKGDTQRKNYQIRGLFKKIDMSIPSDYLKAEHFLKNNLLVA